MTRDVLERALAALGEILQDRGLSFEVVAVGGGSLLLLELISRPTRDIDLVALVNDDTYVPADPMPPTLATAAMEVGRAFGLDDHWLNGGPTDLLRLGLPDGFRERVETRVFSHLKIHLAGRFDQICFKLYAAVDKGPNSKHFEDLKRLKPSHAELVRAAQWCVTHDPSDPFSSELQLALAALGVDGGND